MPFTKLVVAMFSMMHLASWAADGRRIDTGEAVYRAVCIDCHAPENVMVSAPKAGDVAEWTKRLARNPGGMETLTQHADEGFGAMPPKGGAPSLTRTELRDAINYMRRHAAAPVRKDQKNR